jgi:hypothetical protein
MGVFRSDDNGTTWVDANGHRTKMLYSFVFGNGFLFAGKAAACKNSRSAVVDDANGNALNQLHYTTTSFTRPHLVAIAVTCFFI